MRGKPGDGRGRRRGFRPGVEAVERRRLLATFFVTQAGDAGAGSLRQAMLNANARPGADSIEFAIPTSTAPGLNVPFPGFDLRTQVWRIALTSPLPVVTDPVTIDGFSQADVPLSFFYPEDTDEPSLVASVPNDRPARDGNTARIRVIVDGSSINRAAFPDPTGFVLDTSHSNLRGLIIDGFADGVEVPGPGDVGNRIQGNSIGGHFLYPVDLQTGDPLPAPADTIFAGSGNSGDGVVVGGTNTTVGGFNPQENNTITLNGGRGVWLPPGAVGNQILGNQIGVLGPGSNNLYVQAGNDAEGVLIEGGLIESAPGFLTSSNTVGGTVAGSGNVISANGSHGVRLLGPGATLNWVEANYIGAAPGGGYRFGAGNPGNVGNGVYLDNAPGNQVGEPGDIRRNVIAANGGAGVLVAGPSASGNVVSGNFIGLTAEGNAALGNALEGVRLESAATGNQIGDDNVISANLRGVAIVGRSTTGNVVSGNFIGTDATGEADLGNAEEGVRIDGAPGNRVVGDGMGSQVISGNNVGVAIVGPSASGTVVAGNFIGTDVGGMDPLANAQQGVLISESPSNTVGGTTMAARNLISSNHWGVDVDGAMATANLVQGNLIGTDVTGMGRLGNEVDGVRIRLRASANFVGGPAPEARNVIAFNARDGVRVEDASVSNAILTNSIFDNVELGINLVAEGAPPPGPNRLQQAPRIDRVRSSTGFTNIEGTLSSTPSSAFTIQFFANPTLDPTGRGEGRRFLGETAAATGADGTATFSANVAGAVMPGESVTATATASTGDTSEFSAGVAEVLGTVQFAMASFEVDESAGEAVVVVTRAGGSGGQASVSFATGGGTATPDVDYTPVSGTLTFDLGVDVQIFRVPILGDELAEAGETIGLVLSMPAGSATLGVPAVAELRIIDDDQPGIVAFAMTNYIVAEEAGTATIAVVRDAAGGAVTVPFATSGGTAVAGVDYLPVSGVVTFAPGETVAIATVPILPNGRSLASPTIGLVLGPPSGNAGLGVPATATLTIINLEVPRITSVTATADRRGILRIVLAFDRPMIRGRIEDLRNYGYSVQIPAHGRLGRLGTRNDLLVPIGSASYDAATRTATLTTRGRIRPRTPVLVQVNQVTDVPGAGVGVADDRGVLLDGDNDGLPGGTFSTTLRAPRPTLAARRPALLPRFAGMRHAGRLR